MQDIGKKCCCGRTGGVVYVAINPDLLTISSRPDRQGFVCKVGATIRRAASNICN